MDVPSEKLEHILAFYKPEYRVLITARVEDTDAKGRFAALGSPFMIQPVEHVTAVEAQLCLTQLMYAACSVWAEQGKFGRVIPFDEYLGKMREHVLFVESTLRFSTKLPPNTPFDGKIYNMTLASLCGNYIMTGEAEFGDFSSQRTFVKDAFKGKIKFLFQQYTGSPI
jgi:hypothetical protein